jgi:thiol-disulfide isomerase/thioredoxin
MRMVRTLGIAAFFAVGLAGGQSAADDDSVARPKNPPGPTVSIKDIGLGELIKHVGAVKEKPVVVDIWATWCLPCREKFPKFVALSQKYKKKAEFISLSIDDAEKLEEAKAFLQAKHADFANFRMKDDAEQVEKKFRFEGVPRYLMFEGGKFKTSSSDVHDVEKFLAEHEGKAKA